jgi:hypothetical protein
MVRHNHITLVFLCVLLAAVSRFDRGTATAQQQPTTTEIKFVVIGDFGGNNESEAAVADMIERTLKPDFIVTVGDNNYLHNTVEGFDASVGRFYSKYIGNYRGAHGAGAPSNCFWPAIGNHDWDEASGYQPYLDFFTLPGNERYYDFVQGPAHFFMINSDVHEPEGRSRTSKQAMWLKSALAASAATWKFVILHHPPFSSGDVHHSNSHLQWPFKSWGAHVVLTGHDHIYERLDVGSMPYFVNGFGGKSLYQLAEPLPQTQFRFNATYGAICITVNEDRVMFQAYTIENGGTLLDTFTLDKDAIAADLVAPDAIWNYLDDGSEQPENWRERDFNDSSWNTGATQIGYGDGDETTVINFGDNAERKHITTCLRHRFNASQLETIRHLRLAMLVDDGAVAYINGREVARFNLPVGPIGHLTMALTPVAEYGENIFREFTVSADVLVEGDNVIAVEVHQFDSASTDVSFDLMLTPIMRQMINEKP